MKKIVQQKGYPDSKGNVHKLMIDAQKSQSSINMNELSEASGDSSHEDFIKSNPGAVLDYIKYHCSAPKPKPATKKKAKPKSDKT